MYLSSCICASACTIIYCTLLQKYVILYILVDVYAAVITYVESSFYTSIRECVCYERGGGVIRYLETLDGSREGGVMNK